MYSEYPPFGIALDGTHFHRMDCDRIPPTYAEVDVTLISDAGKRECTMIAGVVGTRVCSSGDLKLSVSGEGDTVRPVVGWWVYDKI
jgi:hypothetical protein